MIRWGLIGFAVGVIALAYLTTDDKKPGAFWDSLILTLAVLALMTACLFA